MRFTPLQLVYGVEAMFPIECKIPSLKLVVELLLHTLVEEECLLHFARFDEQSHDALLANKAHQKHVKLQYEKFV